MYVNNSLKSSLGLYTSLHENKEAIKNTTKPNTILDRNTVTPTKVDLCYFTF